MIFCVSQRGASHRTVSAVAAAKIFGWNFKDEVRRKPPKKFLQNELAAQAVSAKKRPQEKAFIRTILL